MNYYNTGNTTYYLFKCIYHKVIPPAKRDYIILYKNLSLPMTRSTSMMSAEIAIDQPTVAATPAKPHPTNSPRSKPNTPPLASK